jgi:hypothetical protein
MIEEGLKDYHARDSSTPHWCPPRLMPSQRRRI